MGEEEDRGKEKRIYRKVAKVAKGRGGEEEV
jgi:hypothetical protein